MKTVSLIAILLIFSTSFLIGDDYLNYPFGGNNRVDDSNTNTTQTNNQNSGPVNTGPGTGPAITGQVTAQGTGHSNMSASEALGRAQIAFDQDKANILAQLGPNETITWGNPTTNIHYFPNANLFVARIVQTGTVD